MIRKTFENMGVDAHMPRDNESNAMAHTLHFAENVAVLRQKSISAVKQLYLALYKSS